MNFIDFAFNLFDSIINMVNAIWTFLFQTHSIGFPGFEIFGTTIFKFALDINIMTMMFGGGIVVFLLLTLAKKFIPFL